MSQISIFDFLKEKKQPTEIDGGYLGPRSEFIGYSAYIKSYVWKKKRQVVIEKYGNNVKNVEEKICH